jgi:hypothetical protein
MTPALQLAGGKISEFAVTDEELQVALSEIKALTPKEKRCKQAGLIGFMSKHPDETAKLAKGIEKDKNLARFHILQLRAAYSRKISVSDKSQKYGNKLIKTLRWFAEEPGEKEFGVDQWTHWMESKLLPTRGNRVTGSRLKKYEEHAVPEDWEEYSEEDWRLLIQRVEGDIAKDEAEAFAKIDDALHASSSSDPTAAAAATIKAEPKSALDEMNDQIAFIIQNTQQELKNHQDLLSHALVTQAKARAKTKDTRKYQVAFETDLTTMVTKETYIVKMLTKFLSGDYGNTEDMPKLIKAIDTCKNLKPKIDYWAAKHDCLPNTGKRVRKETETAAGAAPTDTKTKPTPKKRAKKTSS